jgi:hypothetical protein
MEFDGKNPWFPASMSSEVNPLMFNIAIFHGYGLTEIVKRRVKSCSPAHQRLRPTSDQHFIDPLGA